jgi:hypothetical protein
VGGGGAGERKLYEIKRKALLNLQFSCTSNTSAGEDMRKKRWARYVACIAKLEVSNTLARAPQSNM